MTDGLVVIRQLPIIEENLRILKDQWEQKVMDAEAMVCSADTIPAVKSFRADMHKEFNEAEAERKRVKDGIMAPYIQFEAVYKDCITTAFIKADRALANKVNEVESDIKSRCEEGLRDYFDELCAVRHLDWLEYERAGVKIDMASAKAKTPAKLRKQLAEFVTRVGDGADRILTLDNADEIMAEYKRSLDAGDAIQTVMERHKRIEDERATRESRYAELEREAEAARKVEVLAPPVPVETPKLYKCTFTVHTTMDKLKKLKEFLNMEGIQYE